MFLGVAFGFSLGALFFNMLCDLYFRINGSDLVSYIDDNAPYRTANAINEVNRIKLCDVF